MRFMNHLGMGVCSLLMAAHVSAWAQSDSVSDLPPPSDIRPSNPSEVYFDHGQDTSSMGRADVVASEGCCNQRSQQRATKSQQD
jgi:hypothetical protein